MKTKIFLILLTCFLGSFSANAQVSLHCTDRNTKLTIGETLSKPLVERRLGQPTAYRQEYGDADMNDGLVDIYKYQGLRFRCLEHKFYDFRFDGMQYSVYVDGKYLVKVGDTVEQFRSRIPKQATDVSSTKKFITLTMSMPELDRFAVFQLYVGYENNLIKSVGWDVIP